MAVQDPGRIVVGRPRRGLGWPLPALAPARGMGPAPPSAHFARMVAPVTAGPGSRLDTAAAQPVGSIRAGEK